MANKTVKRVKTLGRKVPRKYESKKMEVEEVLKVENESWWVYVLLLSTIVILAQSLKDYKIGRAHV